MLREEVPVSATNLCTCGWPRPLIALTTIDGSETPPNVVPVLVCPQCANVHTPRAIPVEIAAAIVDTLVAEVNEINVARAAAVGDA